MTLFWPTDGKTASCSGLYCEVRRTAGGEKWKKMIERGITKNGEREK